MMLSDRLFSLLDLMNRYKMGDLTLMLSSVLTACRDLLIAHGLSKKHCDDEFCSHLAIALDGLAIMCDNFNADPSLIAQIRALQKSLEDGSADRRELALHVRLQGIIEGIQNNLETRMFMLVPEDRAGCYDNALLFGEEFAKTFPSAAILEMREAGNCYAAARETACVFHCMRVAEYGLRKLATKVGAKITHKGKPCALEYGDWDKVITSIRNRIALTRALSHGTRRERRLQFYSQAADHCEYMKDIWRNEISHTRRLYNGAEALSAMGRVRDFVQLLSKPTPR